MSVVSRFSFRRSAFACVLAICFVTGSIAFAQSTGSIQGTVTDATGASIPNATITVRNQATGEERTVTTDAAGLYVVASLPVGTYRVEAKSSGMQTMVATNLNLPVSTAVRQDFTMKVASTSQTVEITATAPVIENTTVAVGGVVNQNTVQEIPLNGRHFVDLALLVPGTVTPPANGFLTAPLRGQGSFAYNTAGAREDQINFQVNGINVSDPVQNQVTFQPTIATIEEFKIDNQTVSAEYGRNSGSIVNIATRSGTNAIHGEAYEYTRNRFFDARNFSNPIGVVQSPFIRNQFGGDAGGPVVKNKAFFFLSYEGLRQRQAVPLSTQVLTDAQRAQIQSTSDPIIKGLLPLIPAANSPGGFFVGSAVAPVNIEQGTANFSYNLSDADRLNVYYAIQRDQRNEPPSTDGNNLPGFGDMRNGRRQLLTINETKVFSPDLVNEFRLGFNRIYITFVADNQQSASAYGIDSGVTAPIGIPQISVSGAFAFGGIGGFPQGRGDYSAATSDTFNWTKGKHSIKIGAEYRRIDNNNFSYNPSTFSFPSIAAFMNDQANSFTANTSNNANRIYINSLAAFVQDEWKVNPNLLLELGLRYDWFGTPSEAEGRFVVFNPTTDSLVREGQPYNQSALNFQPRVGFAWNPFGGTKTTIRSAYAIMSDQPITGIVTGLASNPPFAFPISYAATTAVPFVTLGNAFQVAGGKVAPVSIAQNYKDSYAQEWNFNIQQALPGNMGLMVGYMGSKGTDLNIGRNYNQPINGVLPYTALSPNSPIDPGLPLSTLLRVYESDGNSNYNALWVTATKQLTKGLQFNASYTFSKSLDDNSKNAQGVVIQNSYDIRGDYGLSDFNAKNRFVFSGVYILPYKGNRFIEGWELSTIVQLQTGNPLTPHTTNTSFLGTGVQRPNVSGPVETGFQPATNGNAAVVTYFDNTSVFSNPGNAFGNLGRNVLIGPGFYNVDLSLVKNTRLLREHENVQLQFRVDAFDLLNQANFGNPGLSFGTSTFGLISSTRFPAGDSGSSRQLQLALKLRF